MRTLCIVPCGQRKIWQKYPDAGPQKVRNVYTGPYAGKCIEYATRFYPSSWCILSAKYGFLFPDDLIPGPYDVTFNREKTNPIQIHALLIQIQEKGLSKYDKIIVLGGKKYSDMIDEVFIGKDIFKPLLGLKLGASISKLNDALKKRDRL